MKRLALASVISLASTLLLAPGSRASGFIVIDSAVTPTGGFLMMPTPIVHPVHPGIGRPPVVRPGVNPVVPVVTPPPLTRPLLKGGVTFGLHMQSEEIKVEINDQVAKTYITQTFMNDTDRILAGTYLFPLPEDTTFSSFSLHIDGKPVEGKILEANEARQQYEQIVRSMVDPGLLEYADYKTVRARIFPIPAHGTKKVELEYTQVLHAENGMLKYRFPLKAEGEQAPVDAVKIDAKLSSKQGLRTIWSPTHTITTTRSDNNQAKISMSSQNSIPDKDFLLYYSVSNKDMAANVLTHKNEGEDGYFLLTLTPPVKANQVVAKDIVLVADTSGSMQGDKIVQTKKSLQYIVNALNAEDRFSIVQFNTDVESYKEKLVFATPENKKTASAFINDLEARGGTNISDALHTGTSMLAEASERPAYIVMMTDGEPTVGETNVNALLKSVSSKRDVRLFDFGVGYDVNTKLLNKLAEEHHGTAQYVEPSENLETALSSFYQKIKSPVLTNVSIAYDGVQVKDVYPREVKDIFAGSQVLLIGKYKNGGKTTLSLTGKVNGVQKAYSFPISFATSETGHSYLPRLWAMRRIGHLTDVAQENGDNKEVVDEIVALSKKYGIISNYTSFLVTDPSEGHGTAIGAGFPSGGVVPRRVAFARSDSAVRGSLQHSKQARFYAAPREMAITDDRPVVRDFREEAVGGSGGAPRTMPSLPVSRGGAFPMGAPMAMASPPPMNMTASMKKSLDKAPVSQTGAAAVANSKAISRMKEVDAIAGKDEAAKQGVKSVDDKTFYFANGTWVDSTFTDKSKPHVITFGSNEYFDLLQKNPGIAKFLAVGKQVEFIFKGQAYKIVSAAAT